MYIYYYTHHYAQLSNGLQPPALIIKKHNRLYANLISHRAANDTALTTVSSRERTSLKVPAGEATQSAAIN